MNLVIDVGNSFVKLAVFEGDTLKHKKAVKHDFILKHIHFLNKNYPAIRKAIMSSVAKLKDADLRYLKSNFDLLQLNTTTKVPFINLYETPDTLGIDRMASVSASVKQFPKSNVLIIDAGTCITYDVVTAKNEYLGGAISPGIRMRYQSLHGLTANLPLLEPETPKSMTGNTTKSAIHSGVIYGVLNEIDGIIDSYRQKYPDLTVILTGGDTKFLSKQLKSSIFANSNFLLEGLNYILQFNSSE